MIGNKKKTLSGLMLKSPNILTKHEGVLAEMLCLHGICLKLRLENLLYFATIY